METDRKTYTYDEAYNASLEYFKGDELAARVWASKYALKDSFGNIYELTPDDMHRRIAGGIARIEAKYPNPMSADEVFSLLRGAVFIIPVFFAMAHFAGLTGLWLALAVSEAMTAVLIIALFAYTRRHSRRAAAHHG